MARDYTIDSVEKLEAALGRLKEAQRNLQPIRGTGG